MALKNTTFILLMFLVGLIFICCGIGLWFVVKSITWSVIGLIIGGTLFVVYSTCRIKYHHKVNPFQWRRTLGFGIGILILIALYVEINYLGASYNFRWDVTSTQQHTLLPQTVKRLEDLERNIRLTAFYVGVPPNYLKDMFKEYERISRGKVVTEIIDPLVKIGYAAQFGQVISGKEKKVFVQSDNDRREINFTKSSLKEESINNAIMQVTRKAQNACFITGHGENRLYGDKPTELQSFAKHLLSNNIIGKEIAIELDGGIPENCDVIVIAGPKSHYTVKEERIIHEYLEEGGDALFLIENVIVTTPDKPLTDEEKEKNPSMNNILRKWGVKVSKDVVVDLNSHASGDVGSPATRNYMAHRAIVNGLDYTFFVRPRSIKMLKDRKKTISLAPIILTTSEGKSWGETNRYLNVKFDPKEDRAGPVPIAFAIMEARDDSKISDTRIIVITDSDFISNAYIDSYSNAQLGLNAISWLVELDGETYLDQNEVKVTKLDLTSRQKRLIAFLLFLGPCLVISLGMVIWMKQSYL